MKHKKDYPEGPDRDLLQSPLRVVNIGLLFGGGLGVMSSYFLHDLSCNSFSHRSRNGDRDVESRTKEDIGKTLTKLNSEAFSAASSSQRDTSSSLSVYDLFSFDILSIIFSGFPISSACAR